MLNTHEFSCKNLIRITPLQKRKNAITCVQNKVVAFNLQSPSSLKESYLAKHEASGNNTKSSINSFFEYTEDKVTINNYLFIKKIKEKIAAKDSSTISQAHKEPLVRNRAKKTFSLYLKNRYRYQSQQFEIFNKTLKLYLNQHLLICKLTASGKFLQNENKWDCLADTFASIISGLPFFYFRFAVKIITRLFKCLHDHSLEQKTDQLANSFFSISMMETTVALVAHKLTRKYTSILKILSESQVKSLAETIAAQLMKSLYHDNMTKTATLYQRLMQAAMQHEASMNLEEVH